MNSNAERALYQIERIVNRRFPELEKFIRANASTAVSIELQQLAWALSIEVGAAERRGERRFMMGRVR